jgi:putative ABC transport system permease protein
MLYNYLIVAWRNLLRNKFFSFINILSLVLGIGTSLLIIQYINFEKSYDKYHSGINDIYRLKTSVSKGSDLVVELPKSFPAAGPAIKKEFPEVLDFLRLKPIDGTIAFSYQEKVFNESSVYFSDSTLFDVFSFVLKQGDQQSVLRAPYSVVLSSSAASRYFGKNDPLNETIYLKEENHEIPMTVTGVYEDIRENSHFTADFFISYTTLHALSGGSQSDNDWSNIQPYTYIRLVPNTDVGALESKLRAIVLDNANIPGMTSVIALQPLLSIHLHSNLIQEMSVNGDIKKVNFLSLIAVFVILIAWINYINLATARSMQRAKEIGVRKAVGSSKSELIIQFLTESLLTNFLALVIAVLISQTFLPTINNLFDIPNVDRLWNTPDLFVVFIAVILGGACLSGCYPAFVLSSFRPASILKGKSKTSSGWILRKALVVGQFIASFILLISTFTIYQQLRFMRNHELGMNIEQILVLPFPNVVNANFVSQSSFFKNNLRQHAAIKYAVSSTSIPAKRDNIVQGGLKRIDESSENGSTYYNVNIDYFFLPAYDLKLLAGRNFSEDHATDNQSVVINEAALKTLGFSAAADIIGKRIICGLQGERTVIGVVRNFHQESLKADYNPIVFNLDPNGLQGYYSVKIGAGASGNGSMEDVVKTIQNEWDNVFPGNPFDYFFLDDYYNAQYKGDQRFGLVFGMFSGFAIVIACLGLLGLTSFTISQRTKEIGLRKVMGASIVSIFVLLSQNFLKLILLAIVIGSPIAYVIIQNILEAYAFHITIRYDLFVIPAILVLLIAFVTISYLTFKATTVNPVTSLRYE